ncbi:chromosome replication protein DnaA [Candidatus Magnetoovum chiemensis]|nr:chromosome replication protein DnaA [Candidatus Magnetoovum chiemensis]
MPGTKFNPLLIYGNVGLGKTHILNAVAHRILQLKPDLSVLYLTSESLANQIISAIRQKSIDKLIAKFTDLDFLLIDDIQFISDHKQTHLEFINIFNILSEQNKQVVLTSDRPLERLVELMESFNIFFDKGVKTQLSPPSLDTKILILTKKIAEVNLPLTDDVIHYIAASIGSNIRELEGAIVKLTAYTTLTGNPVTLDIAENMLKDILTFKDKSITASQILKSVSEYFNIQIEELKSKKRFKEVVIPRQIAIYISKTLTALSYNDIGKIFGGRQHAAIIYTCNQVKTKLLNDEMFSKIVQNIINRIKQES